MKGFIRRFESAVGIRDVVEEFLHPPEAVHFREVIETAYFGGILSGMLLL